MDRAIQTIATYEDSLCVLTSGGVLTVFRKNMMKDDGRVIELLNAVKSIHFFCLIQVVNYPFSIR